MVVWTAGIHGCDRHALQGAEGGIEGFKRFPRQAMGSSILAGRVCRLRARSITAYVVVSAIS